MGVRDELSRNGSGYFDPTAYQAMKNVIKEEKTDENNRFHQLLQTIFYITELAGFKIEGRIVVKDKKTGRVWK